MADQGRDLESAKTRQGYKRAAAFVEDLTSNVPNQTHQTSQNDQLAFLLEKISDITDTIVVGIRPVAEMLLFNQEITEDYIVPVGQDGLTAARGIATGAEVTISAGSVLHFIGDNPDIVSVRASNTMNISDNAADLIVDSNNNGNGLRHTGPSSEITIPTAAVAGWSVGDSVTFYNEGTGNLNFTKGDPSIVFVGGGQALPIDGTCGSIVMTAVDNWNFIGGFI